MITLVRVTYLHEADLLCMKLAENGIETFVPDQNTASLQPLFSNAMGGVRIQINENDLARAREVLKDELPQINRGVFECPNCRSDSVEYEKRSRRFAFLCLLLIGIPLLFFRRECRCNACGYKWKEK